MKNYLLLRQYLAAAILSIMLFAPMVIASTSTTSEESQREEEEPISKSDKECFETCLKNGYDESTCKGVCYSEIKEEKN